jgi:hypothetical protein
MLKVRYVLIPIKAFVLNRPNRSRYAPRTLLSSGLGALISVWSGKLSSEARETRQGTNTRVANANKTTPSTAKAP